MQERDAHQWSASRRANHLTQTRLAGRLQRLPRSQRAQAGTHIWEGRQHRRVSVGVGSCSDRQGRARSPGSLSSKRRRRMPVVREVSGNGAFWMEPWSRSSDPASRRRLRPTSPPKTSLASFAGESRRPRRRRPWRRGVRRHPAAERASLLQVSAAASSRATPGSSTPIRSKTPSPAAPMAATSRCSSRCQRRRSHRRSDRRQSARSRRRGFPGRNQVGKRPQGTRHARSSSSATATKASRTSTRTAASTKAIRTASSKAF